MQEPSFIKGCHVVEAGVKLGYLNQEGNAEVCKAKCSKDLPKGFTYTYENQRTGCKVTIKQ